FVSLSSEQSNRLKQIFLNPDTNNPNKHKKMKKIILATLLVALSIASFAGGNKADKKLLSDLQTALKYSAQVQWNSTSDYNRATFSFNGKPVSAYYDLSDNSLIGFGFRLSET